MFCDFCWGCRSLRCQGQGTILRFFPAGWLWPPGSRRSEPTVLCKISGIFLGRLVTGTASLHHGTRNTLCPQVKYRLSRKFGAHGASGRQLAQTLESTVRRQNPQSGTVAWWLLRKHPLLEGEQGAWGMLSAPVYTTRPLRMVGSGTTPATAWAEYTKTLA